MTLDYKAIAAMHAAPPSHLSLQQMEQWNAARGRDAIQTVPQLLNRIEALEAEVAAWRDCAILVNAKFVGISRQDAETVFNEFSANETTPDGDS